MIFYVNLHSFIYLNQSPLQLLCKAMKRGADVKMAAMSEALLAGAVALGQTIAVKQEEEEIENASQHVREAFREREQEQREREREREDDNKSI